MMRGISPVIATVIILAVTVAIAVAVIGWITGLWGSLTGGTEQLQIYPDSYINATGNFAIIHVRNTGSADATITKIEIEGIGSFGSDKFDVYTNEEDAVGDAIKVNLTADNDVVKAGEEAWIAIVNVTGATAGSSYNVKIYTANGNVFPAIVKAVQK